MKTFKVFFAIVLLGAFGVTTTAQTTTKAPVQQKDRDI